MKRILVIDDSGIFLRSMKSLLESQYEVILAKSGEKGFEAAKKEVPDLILLDYEMPGWDGRETLANLKEEEITKEIPVVFLTDVSDEAHKEELLGLQTRGYLLKPVNSDRLYEKINEIFA